MRLTKRVVEAQLPAEEPYFIWDDDLSGFGIRIFPSGKRFYYVTYYPKQGARRTMSIGQHGKLTCEQARDQAKVLLGNVAIGRDPLEEKRTRRSALTVAELCDQYLATAEKGLIKGKGKRPKKTSTLATDRGRIDRHIKPLLGRRLVIDLRPPDIYRFQDDVTVGKTRAVVKTRKRGRAVVRGGAGTAKRTLGLLGSIMTFAVRKGVIPSNPVKGVERPADGVRDRRLSHEEMRRLGAALRQAEAEGEAWQAILGTRLLPESKSLSISLLVLPIAFPQGAMGV